MSTASLLIELGTAELPPKSLLALSKALTDNLLSGLKEAELIDQQQVAAAQPFASPRRLALLVPQVNDKQADQTTERRGPAVQAAFDAEGNATRAALGFAKSCGVEIDQLERLKTDKGEWLSYSINESGKSIADLITPIIEQSLKRLPIAKRMRWGAGSAEFVRPVNTLIVMHGSTVLPVTILDVKSSNQSRGHRFHSSELVTINTADEYEQSLLQQGSVVANFNTRQQIIVEQIETLAKSVNGVIEPDQALLDEVTGLVEQPTALLGSFDEEFLEVPQECTISAMRDHQKYFHIVDEQGRLQNFFITVSNINSKDTPRVIAGNERVLRARLSDARFFWQTDQKQDLVDRLDSLSNVMFHAKLGSVLDKVHRIESLAGKLASQIGANASIAQRGALLAKADLVTNMVGEFDELQGLMGRYYAELNGEEAGVPDCIEQHYWPKFAGDKLPSSKEAQAVALADRLDSLVGIYAAGEVPTGDKDPYGLRRASLAILRILIEQEIPLNLSELVQLSAELITTKVEKVDVSASTQVEIVAFVRSRLLNYYQAQDIDTNTINAVMACEPDSPLDFDQRLKAVNEFIKLDEASDLAAANKRISNILKKQSFEISNSIDASLLTEKAERELFDAIAAVEGPCLEAFSRGDYASGLKSLAKLRSPVDDFFENVMVMSDDKELQGNRLALLKKLQQLFIGAADISILQA